MILELNWVEMGRYELRFGANEADRLQEAYEAPPALQNPLKKIVNRNLCASVQAASIA